MSTASRGANRENQVKDILEEEGWIVVRGAGSKGIDLIALKADDYPRIIEVKATSKGPFESWGPKERRELSDAAQIAGALPELAWWPPRGELIWLTEADWPA